MRLIFASGPWRSAILLTGGGKSGDWHGWYRKALGLNQAQVAEKMGVTKSRVSQVERGEVSTIEAVIGPAGTWLSGARVTVGGGRAVTWRKISD